MDQTEEDFSDVPEGPKSDDGSPVASSEWFRWMVLNKRNYVCQRLLNSQQRDAVNEHMKIWNPNRIPRRLSGEAFGREYASYVWNTFISSSSPRADGNLRGRVAKAYTSYKLRFTE